MGQVFKRIKKIAEAYLNDKNSDISPAFDLSDEDNELKKAIDNLNHSEENSKNNNQYINFDFNTMDLSKAAEILGINMNATNEEIKIAYKKKIKEYHPDKVADMGEEIKYIADQKARQINAAYDFFKKKRNF